MGSQKSKRSQERLLLCFFGSTLCLLCTGSPFELKLVSQREKDAPVAAVGSPLIEEVGGIDTSFRDAEIPRVGRIVHFHTELKITALSDAGIFYEAHVDLAKAIGTQRVSADTTDTYSRRECAEQRTSSSLQQFRDGHSGRIERRVQVWTNSKADQ